MRPLDSITVHYLVTATIPLQVDAPTASDDDAAAVVLRAGQPDTSVRRLSNEEVQYLQRPRLADILAYGPGPTSYRDRWNSMPSPVGDAPSAQRTESKDGHLTNVEEFVDELGVNLDDTDTDNDSTVIAEPYDELAQLEGDLRTMAQTLPATHQEIAATAEAFTRPTAKKPTPTPAKSTKKTKPKTSKPAPKGKPGRKTAAETARINDAITTALAAGGSMGDAADAAGISVSAVRARVARHNLAPGLRLAGSKSPGLVLRNPKPESRKKAGPKPAPPATPAPNTEPVADAAPSRRMRPALGAKRRILSLYAIGYDHLRLNQRLNGTGVLVSSVLDDDVTEIPVSVHDAIDNLWRRLRYAAVTPSPSARVPRGHPAPGKWDDIDDPNEHHEIRE